MPLRPKTNLQCHFVRWFQTLSLSLSLIYHCENECFPKIGEISTFIENFSYNYEKNDQNLQWFDWLLLRFSPWKSGIFSWGYDRPPLSRWAIIHHEASISLGTKNGGKVEKWIKLKSYHWIQSMPKRTESEMMLLPVVWSHFSLWYEAPLTRCQSKSFDLLWANLP